MNNPTYAPSPPILLHNFTQRRLPDPLPVTNLQAQALNSAMEAHPFSILVLDKNSLPPDQDYDFLFQHVGILYCLAENEETLPWMDFTLSPQATPEELSFSLTHLLRVLIIKEQCLLLHNASAINETLNRQLNQIGVALMSEKDPDKLLTMILERSMSLTGSDAGCLYLVEPKPHIPETPGNFWENKQIRFKLTRNHSLSIDFSESVVNISKDSIIGHTLIEDKSLNIADVNSIPEGAGFRHNGGFDQASGYVTRSMLTVPMKNHQGYALGAIQLINKCRRKHAPITSLTTADEQIIPYRQADLNLLLSLASQASAALENARHEQEVKRLFEGFIMASVTAIESRDPTTSGHSHRVGVYSVALADCLNRLDTGRFAQVRFRTDELRQLRYASLLHDFGKIGVREHILTKSKKMFPHELNQLELRLDRIHACVRWDSAEAKLALHRKGGQDSDQQIHFLETRERVRILEIEQLRQAVQKANEPGPLAAEIQELLNRYQSEFFSDPGGTQTEYLNAAEIRKLCIPQGTLSVEERDEIQNHVSHTFKFLSKIPWTKDLQMVPDIAHAHHEKLNGTGYPRGLSENEIPLASKIMAICDIYDALAAKDRPYKRALPLEKALDILGKEAKAGLIDSDLLQIFIDAKIYTTSSEFSPS